MDQGSVEARTKAEAFGGGGVGRSSVNCIALNERCRSLTMLVGGWYRYRWYSLEQLTLCGHVPRDKCEGDDEAQRHEGDENLK